MSLLVQDILRLGEKQLKEAGIDNAKDEAEKLYCHLMKIDKAKLIIRWAREAQDREVDQFLDLCQVRAKRIPLQHIIGKVNFMGHDFKVKEGVLIPRPETETLVDILYKEIKDKSTLLDLCCGSGIIGICAAKDKQAKVTAVDINQRALDLSQENAAFNGVRIETIKSDLFENIGRKKFNVIACNPPYIPSDVIPNLQIEVRNHDPIEALDGGVDGLEFYKRIAVKAASHMKKNGLLIMEIGHDQAEDVKNIFENTRSYTEVEVYEDLAKRPRVVTCRKAN